MPTEVFSSPFIMSESDTYIYFWSADSACISSLGGGFEGDLSAVFRDFTVGFRPFIVCEMFWSTKSVVCSFIHDGQDARVPGVLVGNTVLL